MAKQELPTPALLRKLIDYNPQTGQMVWRNRDMSFFNSGRKSAQHCCRVWNSRFSGKQAGSYTNPTGYGEISVLGTPLLLHRVAWAHYYGEWPLDGLHIDHINHDRADNRIANLRLVSRKGNQRNLSLRSDNTTGVSGVRFDKTANKSKPWIVRIQIGGKPKHLGCFASLEEAKDVRDKAALLEGYHANHGTIRGTDTRSKARPR